MMKEFIPSEEALFLAVELGRILNERKLKCATAESCTGGLIGAAITAVAGSSNYFLGGIIAYSNEIKTGVLGVKKEIIDEFGAVSFPTVKEMAEGAARLFGADCCVSVSGIAGPGGGSKEKPVGLVYIGTYVCGRIRDIRHIFTGDRGSIRNAAVISALRYLTDQILSVLPV